MIKKIYSSELSVYINGLIDEKRALGYKYNTEAYVLARFDRYWVEQGYTSPEITIDRLEKWLSPSKKESVSSVSQRVYTVKQLALYMNARNISAYIPLNKEKRHKPVIHILDSGEIKELFSVIDQYRPARPTAETLRMVAEYKVIFRLILTTGLRRTEATSIRLEDVDVESGKIGILGAKGAKDRTVYLADDMKKMLAEYIQSMESIMDDSLEWLFPGIDKKNHISSGGLGIKFHDFWKKTGCKSSNEKNPTIHSLRHTYVVMRMNVWMEQGIDFRIMMPYLSKSLGHKSPNETYYYYHQVADAFQVIQKKDTMASAVIPEVRVR
ncbi:tyrosine-type recombinase/integrase [Anaerocolumna sp. MB42-C2]|uniref:tyrosine-type recombinase/integrase n=1 Tax=Anaerocolumna sp. MB42-C2 TaxID=3070997 RepID=UPI0027DF9807|nr:tyrosine-type recombinase/integrase [Anaerocolumna sp. MB42-C2]WMJ90192.1 tyrosine-type recombinase/integrase [Anaerocolumna sp. MB42-C2]